jgi:hypothetical protein
MTAFIAVSSLVMGLLAFIWTRKSNTDLLVKLSLTGLSIWGLILFLMQMGYVVHK